MLEKRESYKWECSVVIALRATSLQHERCDVVRFAFHCCCAIHRCTISMSDLFVSLFFTSITLRMICGCVVMLRTDHCENAREKNVRKEKNGKETPTLTRRDQLILMVSRTMRLPLRHTYTPTPTRTSQTHCTLSEDNFEVNKRNKFVPSPSNKILWNWLLRTREPTVWDGEGERKRELSKKDVSTYVVARKWMHSKVYPRSVSAFFSNSFVRQLLPFSRSLAPYTHTYSPLCCLIEWNCVKCNGM